MKYLNFLIFSIFILFPIIGFGQSIDSLSKLPYDVLIENYKNIKNRDYLVKAKPYVQAVLQKAKVSQKVTPIASGYREMAFYYYKTKDFDFASQVKLPICLNVQNKDYKAISNFVGTPSSKYKLETEIKKLESGKGLINIGEPKTIKLRQWWKTKEENNI